MRKQPAFLKHIADMTPMRRHSTYFTARGSSGRATAISSNRQSDTPMAGPYSAENTGVITMAHLGGMAFGFFYLKVKFPSVSGRIPDWRALYRQWKMQRAKKKFQVYMKKHGRGGPFVN